MPWIADLALSKYCCVCILSSRAQLTRARDVKIIRISISNHSGGTRGEGLVNTSYLTEVIVVALCVNVYIDGRAHVGFWTDDPKSKLFMTEFTGATVSHRG